MAKKKLQMQKRTVGFDIKSEWGQEVLKEAEMLGLRITDSRMVNKHTYPLVQMALHNLRHACDEAGDDYGVTAFMASQAGEIEGYIEAEIIGPIKD